MTLSVSGGCFAYGGQTVLKNIDFSAGEGDVLAILGPNGAGKTTLLRCIMGFLKWQSGESYIDGMSIRSVPQRKLWQQMAYVPQAKEFTSSATVREAVMLGRMGRTGLFSQPTREDQTAAEEALDSFGILSLADKSCRQISGGELQMVLIARAIASGPKLLILDEPESNLDFRNQLIVLNAVSGLAKKGMTCVFNTHYPAHALQRANKALLLKKGGGCIFGDAARVVTEENIERCFGVRAVIGEVETEENTFRSVLPLELSGGAQRAESESRIAVVSIIAPDRVQEKQAEKINEILHRYSEFFIGRMGMPYRKRKVNIINLTLEAAAEEISALVSELTLIDGVSVKATYAKENAGM